MKTNNENETYTIHFMFHTNILHIKFSSIQVIKNIKIAYQVMGRQQITQNMIHDYSSRRIYSHVYIDYLIE